MSGWNGRDVVSVSNRLRRVRDYYRYYRKAEYPVPRRWAMLYALKVWNPRSYG